MGRCVFVGAKKERFGKCAYNDIIAKVKGSVALGLASDWEEIYRSTVIFSLPGMGKLTVDAVFDKDPEMVLSGALVAGFLGLVSFLLADIAYAIADPRVSYEGAST